MRIKTDKSFTVNEHRVALSNHTKKVGFYRVRHMSAFHEKGTLHAYYVRELIEKFRQDHNAEFSIGLIKEGLGAVF